MDLRDKVEKKLMQKQYSKEREQRYLIKRSELDESLEEVFDRQTLMTIYEMLNTDKLKEVMGVVSAGKESRIYHGFDGRGEEVAIKIYLVSSAEFRRNRLQYVVNDPRFKKIPRNFRKFIYLWSEREYANLIEAFTAGVAVPEPIYQANNVMVMKFLGEKGIRYPLLHEESFERDELETIYNQVVAILAKLYNDVGMVHGDLSHYNVMVGSGLKVYLIDLAQAVKKTHPMAWQFLQHGIDVLCNFFNKAGLSVDRTVTFNQIVGGEVTSG